MEWERRGGGAEVGEAFGAPPPGYSEKGFEISSPLGSAGSDEVDVFSLEGEEAATPDPVYFEGGAVKQEDQCLTEWGLNTESILVNFVGLDALCIGNLSQGCEALHTRVDGGMREKHWLAWLASPSSIYVDVDGGINTMKEAIIGHMASLMDSQKPCCVIWQSPA